ncbi:hypothetical protein ACFFRR_005046 [Megaselia abdita]
MEVNSKIDVEDYRGRVVHGLCRACLTILDLKSKNVLALKSFPDLLELVNKIQIEKSNHGLNLPPNICETCYKKIQDLVVFQKQCNESFHNFQYLLKSKILTDELPGKNAKNGRLKRKIAMIREDEVENSSPIKRTTKANKKSKLTEQSVDGSFTLRTTTNRRSARFTAEMETHYETEENEEPLCEIEPKVEIQEDSVCDIKIEIDIVNEYIDENISHLSDLENEHESDKENEESSDNDSNFSLTNKSKKSTKKYNYECRKCDKKFLSETRYKAHQREQHLGAAEQENADVIYKCEEPGCSKTYSRHLSFENHMRYKHPNKFKKKTYQCEECEQDFPKKSVLKAHMKSLNREKKYHCEICQRKFLTEISLDQHAIRHTSEPTFECPYCGLKKYTKKELGVHINYHTKERPYPCTWPGCSYISYRGGEINRHLNAVHKKIKNYFCKLCHLGFYKINSLKSHETTHLREKPFSCDICSTKFTRQDSMQTHRLRHFKEKADTDREDEVASSKNDSINLADAILSRF